MKVQIASDLHLELESNMRYFEEIPLAPTADILILAGDVMCFDAEQKFLNHSFWNRVSADFKQVYVLPGNHEYYDGLDITQIGKRFDIRSNVHIINNDTEVLGGNLFVFTTLWSDIPICLRKPMLSHANDFKYIRKNGNILSFEEYKELHEQALQFLFGQLNENYENKVVVSHHIPLLQLLPERLGNSWGSSLYANRLDELIQNHNIHTWIYGHSHLCCRDSFLYGTSFYTNPFGYRTKKENPCFKFDKSIDI